MSKEYKNLISTTYNYTIIISLYKKSSPETTCLHDVIAYPPSVQTFVLFESSFRCTETGLGLSH